MIVECDAVGRLRKARDDNELLTEELPIDERLIGWRLIEGLDLAVGREWANE
ncbi:MAG: hypothetical protein JXM70_02890 [Pirellulales bacterium]|nr:hypothetical protein [Pirellulales bacterium]